MAKQTFEQALNKLEQIVRDLETGDLPLEQAFKKFEEGVKLSKLCSNKLDETEKKITVLLNGASGNVTEKSFTPDHE